MSKPTPDLQGASSRERRGIIVVIVYGVVLCVLMLAVNGHLG